MEKPILYRFKFNEESGELDAEAIEDYREVVWYDKREYRYKLLGTIRVVRANNIDKYIYEQVHSFNPDINHAKQIIKNSMTVKYLKASEDAERYRKILEKLNI